MKARMPSISKDARVKAKTTSALEISQHPMLVAVRTSHGSDSSMVSTKKTPFSGSSQKKILQRNRFIVKCYLFLPVVEEVKDYYPICNRINIMFNILNRYLSTSTSSKK